MDRDTLPVIIDDLNLVGVALPEREANPPTLVHGHCPLILAAAFELVQADALQRADILQRLRNVQGQQQIRRLVEIEPAIPVRPLALPDLAGHGIAP